MAEAKATGKQEETQVVRIWDDPESRINFLETVLKDKEWEAVVYHPDFAPDATQKPNAATPLPELEQKLLARGYKTQLGQDANGIPILKIRNFGADTSLVDAVQELGFAKGMTHKITHIKEPLGNALSKTAHMVKHIASDKARLIGGLYMVGDLFLIFAGLGNKQGQEGTVGHGITGAFKDKANLLQSAAGVAATIQSLIYMGFAKEGSEGMYSELMNRAKDASAHGKDLLDASVWADKTDGGPKGLLGLPHKILKSYPIQLGALTQIAGQAALMGSGGIRLKRAMGDGSADARRAKRGALQDMFTATTSMIGWTLLTKTKSEKIAEEDKLPWSNPKRVWQEMSANPNKFASGFLSAATLSGIAAGQAKGNKIQTMGNLTYLVGDGIMFATKSDDYGAEALGNSAMLAEAAERFVKAAPVLLGAKEQAQFVQQLSNHLAERSLHEDAKKTKQPVTTQAVQELGQRIAADLTAKLPNVNAKANEAAARIAHVVEQFHPYVGEKIVDSLCATVSQLNGVSIDAAELKSHVVRQLEFSKDAPTKQIKMDDVAKPLADLFFALPGGATPDAVNKIYDALDAHLRPEPMQSQEKLETAINQVAQQAVVEAAQQQAPAQQAPAAGAHSAALLARQQNGMGAPANSR